MQLDILGLKQLASCIEEIITGQKPLIDYFKEIKTLTEQCARKIIRRQARVVDEREQIPPNYVTVDVNNVDNEEARTVSAEHVVYEVVKELEIDRKLKSWD